MSDFKYSIVEFFGREEDDGHSCGYCKGNSGSVSDGMWAHSLTVQDYQDLIDQGWRRSGLYCYKPRMKKTCCPQYTIKCAALDFNISKSQKKVLKKMNKFLTGGLQKHTSQESVEMTSENAGDAPQCREELPDLSASAQASLTTADEIKVDVIDVAQQETENAQSRKEQPVNKKATATAISSVNATENAGTHSGDIGIRTPLKKAKLMRQERRLEKLRKKGIDPTTLPVKNTPPPVTLEQLLQPPPSTKHNLELRLVQSNAHSEEFLRSKDKSFQVYRKYQIIIHNDPPEKVTEKQFLRFLVNSPLEPEKSDVVTFGSYHQQYWLDGQLIAVGVIDLLPNCISSVYFYYDPDFSHLSLGTYAALREIALTRELHRGEPSLQFYYMGFYIHSCPKMRYKGHFSPSFLVCPATYTWHPLETCRALLDKDKYSVFSSGPRYEDKPVDLAKVLVLYRHTAMPYLRYVSRRGESARHSEDEVRHYAKLVGPQCASRMLLVRS